MKPSNVALKVVKSFKMGICTARNIVKNNSQKYTVLRMRHHDLMLFNSNAARLRVVAAAAHMR